MTIRPESLSELLRRVRLCQLCREHLPMGPRPIVQISSQARLLIAGQAPGAAVHRSGVPFDDASGERLREWMGLDVGTFLDSTQLAIVPMGFCYPGKGRSGDLPPRSECAPMWRQALLDHLQSITLTLVIGNHARKWHFAGREQARLSLTEQVRTQDVCRGDVLVLPHPSPRNNIWLSRNRWFEQTTVPELQQRIRLSLTAG